MTPYMSDTWIYITTSILDNLLTFSRRIILKNSSGMARYHSGEINRKKNDLPSHRPPAHNLSQTVCGQMSALVYSDVSLYVMCSVSMWLLIHDLLSKCVKGRPDFDLHQWVFIYNNMALPSYLLGCNLTFWMHLQRIQQAGRYHLSQQQTKGASKECKQTQRENQGKLNIQIH